MLSSKPNNTKFCSNCGAVIDIKAEICPKCGVRASPPPVLEVRVAPSVNIAKRMLYLFGAFMLVASFFTILFGIIIVPYGSGFYLPGSIFGIVGILAIWMGSRKH